MEVNGITFRKLKADEIDCRISIVKQTGVSLLLYKDARVDQNILDETVGAFNWKRSHLRDNANCVVSIWDDKKCEWVSKEDTGTESYTEKEKGLASDSFKRACFNWGIGRELYTAPFIWIPAERCKIVPKGDGFTCNDRFKVSRISYDEKGNISGLTILKDKEVVFSFGDNSEAAKEQEPAKKQEESEKPSPAQLKMLESLAKKHNLKLDAWIQSAGKTRETITAKDVGNMLMVIKRKYGDA